MDKIKPTLLYPKTQSFISTSLKNGFFYKKNTNNQCDAWKKLPTISDMFHYSFRKSILQTARCGKLFVMGRIYY